MFFTDRISPWIGGGPVDMEMTFIGCTMLCSGYGLMKRSLANRPEVQEFRDKWVSKEITPEDLAQFIDFVIKDVQKPNISFKPYDDIFAAIALALEPFYQTDAMAKEYIDYLTKSSGIMKSVAGDICKKNDSSS